jgi:polyhydroxybutyrate depolymerase
MKLLSIFLLICGMSLAQQTINGSITHDGLTRTYILYVPASYSPGTPVPLVFNFHGYTSNSTEQMFYGDFRPIADTANFILVHPMGTLDGTNEPYWNAGFGGTVDDIGFTSALIDSLSADYSINPNRIYSTGMSNGGFMSYTLACELSNRIAAIASVTGTMATGSQLTCSAQHPTPVMEIHGTADATVPYNGNTTMISTPNVLNFWVNYNNCNTTPTVTQVTNTSTTDGCTAEHSIWSGGDNGVEVEHYKIINGGHTWPGAPIAIGVTNYDINASELIWKFFSKYDLNGLIDPLAINEPSENQLTVYPNPSSDFISVKGINNWSSIEVVSINGRKMICTIENSKIDVRSLNNGVYFITIEGTVIRFVKM